MLRKIFIGLVILSTLASEGAVDIPWNIYTLYLCANNGRSLGGGLDAVKEHIYGWREGDAALKRDSQRVSVVSGENTGIASLGLSASYIPRDISAGTASLYKGPDLLCGFSSSPGKLFHKSQKENIIRKSDTSPPC